MAGHHPSLGRSITQVAFWYPVAKPGEAGWRLIRDVGFEPVDVGPLRISRYLEPFSLAMAQLAYEGDEGPEIAYHIERFGK